MAFLSACVSLFPACAGCLSMCVRGVSFLDPSPLSWITKKNGEKTKMIIIPKLKVVDVLRIREEICPESGMLLFSSFVLLGVVQLCPNDSLVYGCEL